MEQNHGIAKEELRPISLQRRCLGSGPEWVNPVRRSQEKKKRKTKNLTLTHRRTQAVRSNLYANHLGKRYLR